VREGKGNFKKGVQGNRKRGEKKAFCLFYLASRKKGPESSLKIWGKNLRQYSEERQ